MKCKICGCETGFEICEGCYHENQEYINHKLRKELRINERMFKLRKQSNLYSKWIFSMR